MCAKINSCGCRIVNFPFQQIQLCDKLLKHQDTKEHFNIANTEEGLQSEGLVPNQANSQMQFGAGNIQETRDQSA